MIIVNKVSYYKEFNNSNFIQFTNIEKKLDILGNINLKYAFLVNLESNIKDSNYYKIIASILKKLNKDANNFLIINIRDFKGYNLKEIIKHFSLKNILLFDSYFNDDIEINLLKYNEISFINDTKILKINSFEDILKLQLKDKEILWQSIINFDKSILSSL